MKSLSSLTEPEVCCLTATSLQIHTHTPSHSHTCNDSHWQWPQCWSHAFTYTNTCAHTVVRLCCWAAGEWRRSGVKHWLSVFGQVNRLNQAAQQQQQKLNRPLVWVQLQEGWQLKSFDQKHAVIDVFMNIQMVCAGVCGYLVPTLCRFDAWLFSTTPCFTHSFIQSHIDTLAVQHNHSLSVELCCRSCRGLIALLKGIIVINIDRRESVTHLLSLCQDYL